MEQKTYCKIFKKKKKKNKWSENVKPTVLKNWVELGITTISLGRLSKVLFKIRLLREVRGKTVRSMKLLLRGTIPSI